MFVAKYLDMVVIYSYSKKDIYKERKNCMNEIGNLLASGVISIIISIVTTILTGIIIRYFNENLGKIHIYRKIITSKFGEKFGVYGNEENSIMILPVYIEIINAKNIPYVIRDFNMEIWNKGKRIDSMVQSNEGTIESERIIEKTFYGENGIYSFLIEKRSIKHFEFLFLLKKDKENQEFDEIRISYYDINDKKIVIPFFKDINSWEIKEYIVEREWTKL